MSITNFFVLYSVLMIVISGIATLVYVLIYKALINKRVRQVNAGNAENNMKAIPSPIKMFFVFLISEFLLLIILIVSVIYSLSLSGVKSPPQEGAPIQVIDDPEVLFGGQDNMEVFSSDHEKDGYVRYEETSGDYHFVYYITQPDQNAYPMLKIYVEYTGTDKCSISFDSIFDYSIKNDDTEKEGIYDFTKYEKKGGIDNSRSMWLSYNEHAEYHTYRTMETITLYVSGTEKLYEISPEEATDVGSIKIDMAKIYS